MIMKIKYIIEVYKFNANEDIIGKCSFVSEIIMMK